MYVPLIILIPLYLTSFGVILEMVGGAMVRWANRQKKKRARP